MKLLYETKFGSHLYGTDTPNSDTDYKGIYLPEVSDMIMFPLVKVENSINNSTGNDVSKNNTDDVDKEHWSVQYWLTLLRKGDTGAIDLLFSRSNTNTIMYDCNELDELFNNPLRLFNPKDTNSVVRYCVGQAKKYGIKGSRLGVIKKVYQYLDIFPLTEDEWKEYKLSSFLNDILKDCYDSSYCFHKTITVQDKIVNCLCLCGKLHMENISMLEFKRRIDLVYEEYGMRARLAEENKGIDWKALSHAIRSIEQVKQLLTTAHITFPLVNRDVIMKIKIGEYTWNEVEKMIVDGLNDIDELIKNSDVSGCYDEDFVKSVIHKLYFG